MARHLLLILLAVCAAAPAAAASFDATSADFAPSYLATSATADNAVWRAWNGQAATAPVVATYQRQAGPLPYSVGSEQGIGIQAAGTARNDPAYAVLGASLDMILARATDDQGIYVVARAPFDLLASPALLVPATPVAAMSWTADPWGPDYLAHPGQTLTYTVISLSATAPRSGLPGCLRIEETNSYDNQKRTFYWQVGTPWPVEVQDDRSVDAGTTLTWAATPATDLIAPADPVGVWIRQGGSLAGGEYRIVAFFANGTWGRFQRLAAEGGSSLWQIGTWRVDGPGTIETTVTYRVGNASFLDALGSTTSGRPFSQSPTGTLTFDGEAYDRAAQAGTDGAYWFGQDPDGYGVVADLDGVANSGDEPVAGLAVFAGAEYLYWEDDGGVTVGSEWGTATNVIPVSGFDATVAGDENGPSGFSTGAMFAMFSPTGLLAPGILPGMGNGFRIAAAEFPVLYDGNGASGGFPPAPQSKVQGVTLVLDANSGALTRTGATFSGWNTAADGFGDAYAAGGSYTIDAPTTLYAQWTLDTYPVVYDANGGTGAITSATKSFGIDLVLSDGTGFTRAGQIFLGWDTLALGGGTAFPPGATYAANAALTLYAQWMPMVFPVVYDANGGTGAIGPDGKVFAIDLPLSDGTGFTRVGHTFLGWNTLALGGGAAFAAGATYSVDEPVTLYAQWMPVVFPVVYDANGGTGAIASATKSFGIDLTLSDGTGLSRIGHAFLGWDTLALGGGTAFAPGATYAVDAPVTLYAQWTLNAYAVTYDANGADTGAAPPAQTKVHGIPLVLTTSSGGLGRAGSLFAGWNTAADGTGVAFAAGDLYLLDAPATLFAAWTTVPGGGSPTFGFVDGDAVRQVVAGDRVSLPLRISPNLGDELLASVIITSPFAGLDGANAGWPSPATDPSTSLERISGTFHQRLAPAITDQALVLTIPDGATGTMTVAFGPEVLGLIGSGLTSSVVIRAASTTPMTGTASAYVAGANLSPFSIQPGDTVTQQALAGTPVSGPQDLNLVAVNGAPPYTVTLLSGAAEIRPWTPFAAAVDWDGDDQADTGQWFTIVPRSAGTITVRISDSLGQSLDRSMPVLAGAAGSVQVAVPAASAQQSVYTLVGSAGFGGLDALLARFQGAGANPLVRRGFVYGPRSKTWFELPTLPSEGTPMPWDGFYLADRTGDDLTLTVEALGVPPYIPLYPGWNALALPPLRQGGGTVLPAIGATDFDLYDEFGNTIARSAYDNVMGRPQTWNGSTFVELTSIAVGQGFFLKNNLSGANPRMLYVVPGRQALSSGVRAKTGGSMLPARSTRSRGDIVPATGVMGRPPAPPAGPSSPSTTSGTSGGGGACGSGSALGFLVLANLALLMGRGRWRSGRPASPPSP